MDNLNTHKLASLYERFAPEEARRIARKLEIHYTPKHGSLNIAEIELGIFARHCWDRRLGDEATLKSETRKLEEERNAANAKIEWRFTTEDARPSCIVSTLQLKTDGVIVKSFRYYHSSRVSFHGRHRRLILFRFTLRIAS
jgi:hypothetical protein